MVAVDNAVLNGAQLVQKLAESGTGERALRPARDCLLRHKRVSNRVASANEVLSALAEAEVSPLTVEKARQFAATGAYVPPSHRAETPIEQLLLDNAALPPELLAPPEPPKAKADDEPQDQPEPVQLPPVQLTRVKKSKPAATAE